ncbi:hypothetical protein H3C65_03310 [Patescibacteria group bacterium]|nr:hypothetical protein [Patescibacteria group bacterium]
MSKWSAIILTFLISVFLPLGAVNGQVTSPTPSETVPKAYECPSEINAVYEQKGNGEKCTTDYEEFKKDPSLYHYWTDDTQVTIEGRAKERARQFIYWVMNHPSIDNHPVLIKVWSTARNLSYFLVILTAALLGLGIIVGQKTNFDTGVRVWPSVIKIFTSILYIAFSATIVISIIQLSDVLMKFFIENLGGKDLFNIYFQGISQESNYGFYGIKDLNIGAQESVRTQLFVLKLTEITYYILGGMILLRKIILWFLLFVSPFLAIILSFAITKNVGWIWISVFFQWVFYGPLMALFLGGMATIWKAGIPFVFDFSRNNSSAGYIYPTATNILWGGPAQQLSILNNINFIDPYVEYIITLVMLWVVTFFPWWLLRNFRDFCCDSIQAIKNILLSNLPGRTPGPNPSPSFMPSNLSTNLSAALKMQRETESTIKTKIETIEEIKKAKTEEIVHSLDMRATKITDIARIETNKETSQNINYLKNPTQAATATERQKYMNIRVELSNRATKSDPLATKIVSSVFAPPLQQLRNRTSIISSLPKSAPVTQVVSVKVKLPTTKVQEVASTVANTVDSDPTIIADLVEKTSIGADKIHLVLSILNSMAEGSAQQIAERLIKETKLTKEQIVSVLKEYSEAVNLNSRISQKVADELNIKEEDVKEVVSIQTPIVAEPEKHVEQTIVVPQTVSIDEYEQVKKMWANQYEKGEIPVTENIKTREAWVENDIVLITNTLNKLLSENQELKQEGLDSIGYILPIFMVNNLNGEQLIAYLKAKLEAAKTIKEFADREKEVTKKLKSESEKVEVFKPKKKEAEKTMELKEELSVETKRDL